MSGSLTLPPPPPHMHSCLGQGLQFLHLHVVEARYFAIKSVHSLAFYSLITPAVAQLVETLLCKLEGRGFDSRWCH
jgi:hypothetical protein